MGQFNGWKREHDRAGTVLSALSQGQRRYETGSAVLTQEGGASSALLHGLGNSTTRVRYATANHKFLSYYTEGMAASGASEGMYLRHYQGTAGDVTAQALRVFTTVNGVAISNARGAHISLSFGASGGKVSGEASVMKATLHIPAGGFAASAGTLAPVVAEIWSDGATSDPANALLSCFRAVNGGDTTGDDDVDTDAYLLHLDGWTASSGNMVGENTGSSTTLDFANWQLLKIRIGSDTKYLVAAATIAATGG